MTRALVVEDHEGLREVTSLALGTIGFDVDAVEDGARALRLLDEARVVPAVIVLDLEMPVMDGRAFLAWIRRQAPPLGSVPVVLVSGATEPRVEGIAARLTKPFSLDALLDAVRRSLASCRVA